jgi:hypothetical protein
VVCAELLVVDDGGRGVPEPVPLGVEGEVDEGSPLGLVEFVRKALRNMMAGAGR